MHRTLKVLADEQFVVRSEASKRYFVGPAAREIATASTPTIGPLSVVHPALSTLAVRTGETVFITEFVDERVICVSLVEGRHPLRLFVRVGQEMPLHAAASARVLLSGLNDDDATALLEQSPLVTYTPETPRSAAEAVHRLSVIRKQGYDVCDQELDRGVWVVAAPIHRPNGQICAAVSLAAPTDRVPDDNTRTQLTDLVLATARNIATTQS
jgi:IclR family acetate operon transcriptional repressor